MTSDPTPSNTTLHRYDAAFANEIELKWQRWWADPAHETFRQTNPGEPGFDAGRPKFYALDMFPYPSGAGLHVGHPEGYTASDIISRAKRMQGYNVLHPMGWDAFGLPAEQYAIQTGVHPRETTRTAIDNFRRQLQRFGFSYDWSREFGTIDEDYYKWTQWIFLQLYNAWFDERAGRSRPIGELIGELESGDLRIGPGGELVHAGNERIIAALNSPGVMRLWHELEPREQRAVIDNCRLAYLGEQTVNWCPKLGTALANEEVIDGKSERGGFAVYRKPLRQWMFRITAYAERLLEGLKGLDWPASTKTQQAEWIGRSEGALVRFALDDASFEVLGSRGVPPTVDAFTTRPDTLFGVTYMVVAPEHPLIDALLAAPLAETPLDELRGYVDAARNRSDVERQESKEKTGVFTGAHVINPATGGAIPLWTADYVLGGYGTGAVMAVPAHDERDFEFAEAFDLPIEDVVYPAPLYAMWWAGTHADDQTLHAGVGERVWVEVLADFLGYVSTNNTPIEKYEEAIGLVSRRRREESVVNDSTLPVGDHLVLEETLSDDGVIGQQRGIVRMSWIELLESMEYGSLDGFRGRMRQASRSRRFGFAYTSPGRNINSSNDEVSLDGLPTAEAKQEITRWLEKSGHGAGRINFKLRDWLFSRQRYWGEPFPIVFDERGEHYGVSEDALPVTLPKLDDYAPDESDDPQPLLAKAEGWVRTTAGEAGVPKDRLPAAAVVERETNTMPGWAGSCWYYLRYCSPDADGRVVDREAEKYWMGGGGVDLYIGGAEHAVLHLLYARFWHMVLFDLGHVSTPEPFTKLFHQGLILSHAYQRKDRSLVPIDEVENRGSEEKPEFVEIATGEGVSQITAKMSKSLRNVVNPDDIIAEYGADAFRLYEMYMGPLDAAKPWNTRDMVGLMRFLQRAWRLAVNEETGECAAIGSADAETERKLHQTIAKVGEDIEGLRFNTAIAAMIELVNTASKQGGMTGDQLSRFVRILSPFAPHIAEEMWSKLGQEAPVSLADWPAYDEAMLAAETIEIAVQVLGKVKARIEVPASIDRKELEKLALAHERVAPEIEGKTVRKVIVVPGRLVNIVAN